MIDDQITYLQAEVMRLREQRNELRDRIAQALPMLNIAVRIASPALQSTPSPDRQPAQRAVRMVEDVVSILEGGKQ